VNFNIDYKRNPSQYELIITRQPGGLGAAAPIVSGATDTMPAPGIKPIGVERRELPPPPGGEAAPAGTAAPAAPAAPAGGVMPPTATGPFSLTPNAIDAARREAENRFNLPTATIQDRPDLLVAQTKAAEGAETIKPTLIQIGILGSTPRTGMTAQGPLQPVLSEIAGLANDVSRRLFGPTVNPFSAADIADYESWKKKLTELSAAAAKAGDQTAVESLKRLKDLYPAPDQTPGGFAANLAELMVTNQKDIQRAKFFADYSRIAQGDDPRLPGRFDPAAARIFEQEYGGVFEQQREALKRMLRADDPRFLPRDERGRNFLDKNGRPMSWFTYLQMNGSKLSPEQVAEIERAFKAPGIMEYFRTGMGAQ
jgi:hypothetical protein